MGFVDYEKAVDFMNRAEIVRDLVENKTGATFTKAVSEMYSRNYYVPKSSTHRLGEPISTGHGVTQGRYSSTNLFSFALSCIPKAIFINTEIQSQNNHVLQLADDASIISNSYNDLAIAFKQLIEVSESKYTVTKLFVGTVSTNYFFVLNMFKADMEIRFSTSMSSLYRQYVNLTNYIYNPSIYDSYIVSGIE